MAIRCSTSPPIIIQKSGLIKKPIRKLLMLQHNQTAIRKTTTLQIRSSLRNKVFEDRSTGIVCYRDEEGEIICEGYDEGPRIHQGFPTTDCHNPCQFLGEFRDAEIILLLQQNWIQVVKGGEKGVAVQEDLNINGFNTFC